MPTTDDYVPGYASAILNKIKDRVHTLLILLPPTKSSDAILFLEYLRRHGTALVYDANDKLIEFRNKKGITYQEYEDAFKVFESVGRARRKLQEEAFKRIDAGVGTPEDYLICPSERVASRRVLREREVRSWSHE